MACGAEAADIFCITLAACTIHTRREFFIKDVFKFRNLQADQRALK